MRSISGPMQQVYGGSNHFCVCTTRISKAEARFAPRGCLYNAAHEGQVTKVGSGACCATALEVTIDSSSTETLKVMPHAHAWHLKVP